MQTNQLAQLNLAQARFTEFTLTASEVEHFRASWDQMDSLEEFMSLLQCYGLQQNIPKAYRLLGWDRSVPMSRQAFARLLRSLFNQDFIDIEAYECFLVMPVDEVWLIAHPSVPQYIFTVEGFSAIKNMLFTLVSPATASEQRKWHETVFATLKEDQFYGASESFH